MVRVIEDGNKGKKGNAVCPQCGERVLIGTYYGDPPKCSDCGIPYTFIHQPVRYC